MYPVLAFGRCRRLGYVIAYLVALLAFDGIILAQRPAAIDFAEIIKTPAGIQAALERCDGDLAFETAFANWLESAQPRSPAEREAIRKTSLRLLEDTADRQLVLGLIDGLLRHAVEHVKSDPLIVPARMAQILYSDIAKSVKNAKFKARDVALLADSLRADGAAIDQRHASFLQEIVHLADLAEFQHARSAAAEAPVKPSSTPAGAAITTEKTIPVGP